MATAHSEHSFEAHVRPTLEVFVINCLHPCSTTQTRKWIRVDRVLLRRERRSGSARFRTLSRQVEKQDAENQIDGQKLHSLKPFAPSPLI